MSHSVHAVQHEVEHEIKHGGAHGGGLLDNINKTVALFIGVLAFFLALSETLGKSAIRRWRATTTTKWLQRHSKSASFSRPPQ